MAAASLHNDVFFDSERCHERPATRWWDALRAPEVAKWQQTYHVEWDATDERHGGAERIAWEILLEMERYKNHAAERDRGTIALVLDLAKAFERVNYLVVWAWVTHYNFFRKIFAGAMRLF